MKILIFLTTLLLVNTTFACKISTAKGLNIAISPNDKQFFYYAEKTISGSTSFSDIADCQDTFSKRKFLMIALGPEIVDVSDSARGTNFNKEFKPSTCSIKNNPLTNILSLDSNEAIFKSRWQFINKCLQVTVSENGKAPLNFPSDQEGCELLRNSAKSATFKGGYCFFKPSADSKYNVSYSVSQECLTSDAYKNKLIQQDLNANISFYTSSTYKDDLNDLTALGTMPVRLSVNPDSSVIPVSDNFGILRPTFPSALPLTDMHLGKIQFQQITESIIALKVPLIVDNTCPTIQKSGMQTSLCQYSTPFTAEFELKNAKNQTLINWHDGGIAPAQWQGILEGEGTQIMSGVLIPGEKYKIIVTFADPFYDFNLFRGLIKSKIGLINIKLPMFDSLGQLKEIDEVRQIKALEEMVTLDPIGDLNFNSRLTGLSQARRRLGNYFSTNMWPPMINSICNPTNKKCIATGNTYVKFTASFTLGSNFEIQDLKVNRESDLIGNYEKQLNDQPEYFCE